MSAIDKLIENGIRLPNCVGGRSYKVLCPQCSAQRKKKSEPCLSVTIDADGEGAVWNCHNCNWSGNLASTQYVNGRATKRWRKIDRPRASTNTESTTRLYEYFGARKISRETLDEAGVTTAHFFFPALDEERDCIAFPYVVGGELVNVKYRAHHVVNGVREKTFAQEKDARPSLYLADDIAHDELIWCEGEVDVLTMREAGYRSVTTLPTGAPQKAQEKTSARFAPLELHEQQLMSLKRVIIATDNDGPGEILGDEISRRLGRERCFRMRFPEGCKDPNDILVRHGVEVLRQCVDAATPYPLDGIYSATDYADDVIDLYRGGRKRGLSTGWKGLDLLYTVRQGEVTIVTGFPSSGKSEWCDALFVNMAHEHSWRFALCSFENPVEEHVAKLLEKHLRVPFFPGPSRRMGEDEIRDGFRWVDRHFCFIRADRIDASPTIDWILTKARQAVLRDGINGLIIDPFNMIMQERSKNQNETQFIAEMLAKVRRFAAAHAVHCWIVAHPMKPPFDQQNKPPTLYSISGSAHWFNMADNGVVVHRDFAGNPHQVEIFVRKVRFKSVGQPGRCVLNYWRPTGTYRDDGRATTLGGHAIGEETVHEHRPTERHDHLGIGPDEENSDGPGP